MSEANFFPRFLSLYTHEKEADARGTNNRKSYPFYFASHPFSFLLFVLKIISFRRHTLRSRANQFLGT